MIPQKAIAGGVGAGLGGSLAILISALVWPNIDVNQMGALSTVCGAVLSFVSTYYTPHKDSSS